MSNQRCLFASGRAWVYRGAIVPKTGAGRGQFHKPDEVREGAVRFVQKCVFLHIDLPKASRPADTGTGENFTYQVPVFPFPIPIRMHACTFFFIRRVGSVSS